MSGVLAGLIGSLAGRATAFELLESTTLTSAQASVEFTNLTTKYASTYQHLQLRILARTTASGSANSGLWLRMNGDTGANYAWHRLLGQNGAVISQASANDTWILIGLTPQVSSAANAFAASVCDILDPFEANKNRTVRSLGGETATSPAQMFLTSGFRNNTAAVTSLTVSGNASENMAIGTRISLYGIRGS
jgi:hypothetical protein